MQSAAELKQLLDRIDHRGYPAYKDTKGQYQFQGYVFSIDHVQGDPFASPSKVSVQVKGSTAGFPEELYKGRHQRAALQDEMTRQFYRAIQKYAFRAKGSGKSGLISVSKCGQEVLERTACEINPKSGDVKLRFEVGFPANGRTINAREMEKIVYEFLPECVEQSLFYKNCDKKRVRSIIDLAEDQQYIRDELEKNDLIAFVANGAILPRESGVSDKPMKGAVRFQSPKEMEVTMKLPHKGEISGMGIRRGITLIVGGGYHGKSTLLKALELGVYNHIQGDGREYVITKDDAMKIRAEDGRSIKKTDISMFINDLPNGKDTRGFYTEDASGSTSQAANVIESMEAGASVMLIDEDTSATNFMIRDELMQRVIHRDMEPITPFIDRILELYQIYGISTVIVAGSSGAYFHIADTIIQMDRYEPKEITKLAKETAKDFPAMSGMENPAEKPVFIRCPRQGRGFKPNDRIKMKTMGKEMVQLNRENIDLRYVEQLADTEQVSALGYCVRYAEKHLFQGKDTIQNVVDKLEEKICKEGLSSLCESNASVANLAMPRRQEIFACLNRYRGLNL
ncbi:ABC-ATPase domain-containing protein [Mediterraneibacter sp. NSJ-151]|uniref:ABC-ATPase domain-containing protein n=1 Tax=Mediterraneibacter sp. NSJ-151 TaxID=2897708 RepID=UPI001F0AB3D9|nr:ABC-ATPase domain-containing protein [Mediterraneibacter sp. NSJ-151]MCH4280041.1 ABC-ATPase domain-containing protein [Mediterraneibacter sp. NSJ-151]